MSQNQGHTIEEHAFQLRYFIKRIVDNDAWMTACRMLDDLLTYPTKDGVAEIWEFVDEQEKGCSRDEVAKKPRVEQNPRKMHKPRQTRPVKELKYPCTCGKRERFVVKATGKVLPLCPVCHKAGKNEPRVPARLAAPSPDVHAKDLGKAMEEKPVVVAAKIAYKRTVTSVDRDLSEKRFQEARELFRRQGRKPRHTGKTARKNGKISLRRALELA